MTLPLRRLVVLLAATLLCAIAIRAYTLPLQTADLGFRWQVRLASHGEYQITEVRAHSRAYAAGLRTGDIVDASAMTASEALAIAWPRARTLITLPLDRDHTAAQVTFRPNAKQRSPDEAPDLRLAATACAVLGALLAAFAMFKAGARQEVQVLTLFLLATALDRVDLFALAPTPFGALLFSTTQNVVTIFIFFELLNLVLLYPPRLTGIGRLVERIVPPILGGIWLVSVVYHAAGSVTPAIFITAGPGIPTPPGHWQFELVFIAVIWFALADAAAHLEFEYRVAFAWFASAVLLGTIIEASRAYCTLVFGTAPPIVDLAYPFEIVLGAGAAYAIVVRRVVPIPVVLCRLATTACLLIAAYLGYAASSWFVTVVVRAIGAPEWTRLVPSACALVVAFVTGRYVRQIAGAVAWPWNHVLLKQRYERIDALARFSLDVDEATHGIQLLHAAYEAAVRHLDAAFVAVYVLKDGGFSCAYATRGGLPNVVGGNEEIALRLKRNRSRIQLPQNAPVFANAEVFAMPVLRLLTGFIVCGPKRDRSPYLYDERRVLERFARRVAAGYALLNRGAQEG